MYLVVVVVLCVILLYSSGEPNHIIDFLCDQGQKNRINWQKKVVKYKYLNVYSGRRLTMEIGSAQNNFY